jgi:hypothetical protein
MEQRGSQDKETLLPITPAWPTVWRELRERLAEQPHCPLHPEHPCVRTLAQGIINDLLDIDEGGLRVRSHRTDHEDIIDAHRFETWWCHLVAHGSASLHPGDSNNPHPGARGSSMQSWRQGCRIA